MKNSRESFSKGVGDGDDRLSVLEDGVEKFNLSDCKGIYSQDGLNRTFKTYGTR